MKLLVLTILISFSALADVKVTITNLKGGSFQGEFETELEADNWIEDNKNNDSWGRKQRWELYSDQTTCLETKEVLQEVDDISTPYPDPIPEDYVHPQVETVSHQECKMPVEYVILKEDITAQKNDELTKQKIAQNGACGLAVRDHIGFLNIKNNLDPLAVMAVSPNLVNLLLAGTMDTARAAVVSIDLSLYPILDQAYKDSVLAKIDECKVGW